MRLFYLASFTRFYMTFIQPSPPAATLPLSVFSSPHSEQTSHKKWSTSNCIIYFDWSSKSCPVENNSKCYISLPQCSVYLTCWHPGSEAPNYGNYNFNTSVLCKWFQSSSTNLLWSWVFKLLCFCCPFVFTLINNVQKNTIIFKGNYLFYF